MTRQPYEKVEPNKSMYMIKSLTKQPLTNCYQRRWCADLNQINTIIPKVFRTSSPVWNKFQCRFLNCAKNEKENIAWANKVAVMAKENGERQKPNPQQRYVEKLKKNNKILALQPMTLGSIWKRPTTAKVCTSKQI